MLAHRLFNSQEYLELNRFLRAIDFNRISCATHDDTSRDKKCRSFWCLVIEIDWLVDTKSAYLNLFIVVDVI